MRKHISLFVAVSIAGILGAGCQTMTPPAVIAPVAPAPDEQVTIDNLIVVADGSGSMYPPAKFALEKEILRSFVNGVPPGDFQVGMILYGGESTQRWRKHVPAAFDRHDLQGFVASLEWLGASTPLARVLDKLQPGLAGTTGNTALVILSDGEANAPTQTMDAAARLINTAGGAVCIHTVHFGANAAGGQLLANLAAISGCGTAYHANQLAQAEGMTAFVRDVFFGPANASQAADHGPGIYFDTDKAHLREAASLTIDSIAEAMRTDPTMRVRVEGHTDDRGSESYNMTLSEQRANAVKKALVNRGIDASRIDTVGYGLTRPTVPNRSPENRQFNRRAEIVPIP
ncbi:MAG: OmpA family protein [Candidatus Hydrogenedentota bacterium]